MNDADLRSRLNQLIALQERSERRRRLEQREKELQEQEMAQALPGEVVDKHDKTCPSMSTHTCIHRGN